MKVIIVLGSSDLNICRRRVDRAIEEFQKQPAEDLVGFDKTPVCLQKILFSGSNPKTETYEAILMKNYAESRGIDSRFLLTETESRNTIENFLFSKKILENNYPVLENVCICTSNFHIARSMMIAKFILKDYYLSFIATREVITPEEKQRENVSVIHCLEFFKKQLVNT